MRDVCISEKKFSPHPFSKSFERGKGIFDEDFYINFACKKAMPALCIHYSHATTAMQRIVRR